MPTSTFTLVRRAIGEEMGIAIVIANADFNAVAAGSVSSLDRLGNTNHGSNHWAGWGIFRPDAASAADYFRPAGTLTNTTGLLGIAVTNNYADTTVGTEPLELWKPGIRPEEHVLKAVNRVLRNVWYTTFVMVSHLTGQDSATDLDGDMAATGVGNWAAVGTPTTRAKSTSEFRTPWGLRNTNVINDAADEGIVSATIPVTAQRLVTVCTINSCNVNSGRMTPYDVTNSAEFNTSYRVDNAEQEPQLLLYRNAVVPTTCEQMSLRLLGTGTLSDNFWNQAAIYKHDNLIIRLPSYITDNYQAPEVFYGVPQDAHPTVANVYNAQSLVFDRLKEGKDYRVITAHADANPNAIRMLRQNPYQYPIFVSARVPHSFLGDYSTEASTAKVPFRQLVAGGKIELIRAEFWGGQGPRADFAAYYAEAQNEWMRNSVPRGVEPQADAPFFPGPDPFLR